jgi:hypothetical protein
MPHISIYLTRDACSKNDDVITIKKNTQYNEFELTYTEPNEGSKIKQRITGMYREKILQYMYLLMKNLYLDEQKFKNVQFNIPGMPRMIVSCGEFSDLYYREHFEELVGFGLDCLENVEDVKERGGSENCDYVANWEYVTPARNTDREAALNREVNRGLGVGSGGHLFFD